MWQYCRRWNNLKEKNLADIWNHRQLKRGWVMLTRTQEHLQERWKEKALLFHGNLLFVQAYWGFADHFKDQADVLLNALEPNYRRVLQVWIAVQFFKSSSSHGFANWPMCRVRWATLVQATAWTLLLNQAKLLAEHQPGHQGRVSLQWMEVKRTSLIGLRWVHLWSSLDIPQLSNMNQPCMMVD